MVHKCNLEKVEASRYYTCDIANKHSYKPLENLNCLSGVTQSGPGEFIQRYRCGDCDFDTCVSCTLRYAYTPIEFIKPIDIRFSYFILSNSIEKETRMNL